jgi:hypothetical protein
MLIKKRKSYRKACRKSYRKSCRKAYRKSYRRRRNKSRRGGKDDSVAVAPRVIHVFVLDEQNPIDGRLLFNDSIPFNATPEEVTRIIIDHPSNVYGNRITEGVYRIIAHVDDNDNYYIIENHNHPETELERRLRNLNEL